MKIHNDIHLNREEANSFLSRKLLKNSWHHFEETQQGNLERECMEEVCSWEEAREVFETDVDSLTTFWAQYTGQTNNSSQDNPVGMIIGILFGVIGFFIVIILVYVLWKRQKGDLDKKMAKNSEPYTPYPMLSYYSKRTAPPSDNVYETPVLDNFDNELAMGLSECYLERERLQLGVVITSGNFGDVWKGKLRQRDNSHINVAVKSLKNVDDPEDIEKFLREGVMMRGLDHPNVLSLLGVCMDADMEHRKTSPLIVLPFMENGDLRTYLRDGNNVLTVLHLLRFCADVAKGMAYLAEKKFVHRDLAARNCMVDSNESVRVADFGLSRDLFDRDYYRSSVKTQLPLKWMPPESIKYGKYGEKSDVWSYGVVIWEIMTRGAIPYPTVQAVDILQYLGEGKRMERPECCPAKLYKITAKCWMEEPDSRPTFEELVNMTSNLVRDAKKSVRRRNPSSEAGSSIATASKSSNPYQNSQRENSAGDRRLENFYWTEPKPKPRNSLRTKSGDRTDKYRPTEGSGGKGQRRQPQSNGEVNQKLLKKRDARSGSGSSSGRSSHRSEVEVGVYHGTDDQGRTISV
uniref:Uncharacterized protein LOC780869 n=1 Tax=Phallusia mammillata TaxID=59560 RepID=A0A6F9DK65_9ASCI|nr:uncharacterized protein LOC780869 [Phallusia mammillata]